MASATEEVQSSGGEQDGLRSSSWRGPSNPTGWVAGALSSCFLHLTRVPAGGLARGPAGLAGGGERGRGPLCVRPVPLQDGLPHVLEVARGSIHQTPSTIGVGACLKFPMRKRLRLAFCRCRRETTRPIFFVTICSLRASLLLSCRGRWQH